MGLISGGEVSTQAPVPSPAQKKPKSLGSYMKKYYNVCG